MTTTEPSLSPAPARPAHDRPWEEVVADLGVDPGRGLSDAEVHERRAQHGANELAEAPRDPAWRRFARQFEDLLILILLAAAVVSFVVSCALASGIGSDLASGIRDLASGIRELAQDIAALPRDLSPDLVAVPPPARRAATPEIAALADRF